MHLDLKPQNVLSIKAKDGGFDVWKLSDFGLARHEQTVTIRHAGTRGYVAPDIILQQRPTVAADQWSLGILIFNIVTCERVSSNSKPTCHREEVLNGLAEKPHKYWSMCSNLLNVIPTERGDAASTLANLDFENPNLRICAMEATRLIIEAVHRIYGGKKEYLQDVLHGDLAAQLLHIHRQGDLAAFDLAAIDKLIQTRAYPLHSRVYGSKEVGAAEKALSNGRNLVALIRCTPTMWSSRLAYDDIDQQDDAQLEHHVVSVEQFDQNSWIVGARYSGHDGVAAPKRRDFVSPRAHGFCIILQTSSSTSMSYLSSCKLPTGIAAPLLFLRSS